MTLDGEDSCAIYWSISFPMIDFRRLDTPG